MTEADIRRAVIAQLAESPSGRDAAFISEMFLDQFSRRADLVMANGMLSAFEIKSGLDNLDRLDGQLETYQRLFEQVTIVCAEKHASQVQLRAPESVGVWIVSKQGCIEIVRRAKSQTPPSKESWLSFLPVDELRAYLRECGRPSKGTRSDLVDIAVGTSASAIRNYVLRFLKRRDARIEVKVAQRAERRLQAIAAVPTTSAPYPERLEAFLRRQQTDGALVAIPRQRQVA